MYVEKTNLIFFKVREVLLAALGQARSLTQVVNQSLKVREAAKSSSLNVLAIKAIPPPPGLNGRRIFF